MCTKRTRQPPAVSVSVKVASQCCAGRVGGLDTPKMKQLPVAEKQLLVAPGATVPYAAELSRME